MEFDGVGLRNRRYACRATLSTILCGLAAFLPERSVVALGRKTLIGAGAALCFLTAWASGATWYLISHDEIVARFLARQTEMQYAYEDRIAALRTHLDRVASQKLLEQDGFEGRVSDLITRQVQLETRQAMLTTLAERAGAPPMAGTARGLEPTFSPYRLRAA
jgi:hypothetical protein